LHTYRGRQGADVALVIRKLKQRNLSRESGVGSRESKKNTHSLLCIGTSATMSTEGSRENRQQTVADVASKLFGVEIKPDQVIDETLEKAISRPNPTINELIDSIQAGIPPESQQTENNFKNHPLSAWIEMNFGLEEKDGHLTRRQPISLQEGASKLSELTKIDQETCLNALKGMFLWSSYLNNQNQPNQPPKGLPFRLHQFISQGGSVYATLQPHKERELTLEGKYKTTGDRLLFPLVFCRECGQDYYVVKYDSESAIKSHPCYPLPLKKKIQKTQKKVILP
jgi:hypothetical protein